MTFLINMLEQAKSWAADTRKPTRTNALYELQSLMYFNIIFIFKIEFISHNAFYTLILSTFFVVVAEYFVWGTFCTFHLITKKVEIVYIFIHVAYE